MEKFFIRWKYLLLEQKNKKLWVHELLTKVDSESETMRFLETSIVTIIMSAGFSGSQSTRTPLVQKFVREPPDQTAAEGEHVTLPCRVHNKIGRDGRVDNLQRWKEIFTNVHPSTGQQSRASAYY